MGNNLHIVLTAFLLVIGISSMVVGSVAFALSINWFHVFVHKPYFLMCGGALATLLGSILFKKIKE